MLFKRGSTISAAEGGCQAEVGGDISTFASDIQLCAHDMRQLHAPWLVQVSRLVWGV